MVVVECMAGRGWAVVRTLSGDGLDRVWMMQYIVISSLSEFGGFSDTGLAAGSFACDLSRNSLYPLSRSSRAKLVSPHPGFAEEADAER